MAKYTTMLRSICESITGLDESVGGLQIENVISAARPLIFDFSYPIFDAAHKEALETRILSHYYMREIGLETYGLWKWKLNVKMNEIMPYYNQLYQSVSIANFNPFEDVDYTRSGNRDNTGKETASFNNKTDATNTSTNSNNSKNLFQETPQNGIADVEAARYLTEARIINDTGSSNDSGNTTANGSSDSSVTNNETYSETIKGKQGTTDYPTLLKKYRETFLNIDMMIIEELSDLFMGVW